MTLEELKHVRLEEIDLRTGELISAGFTFGGHTFSMSTNAQINWSNFPNLPDALFPIPVMDIQDGVYSLSLSNKTNFYLSALGFKNTVLQSGSTLKTSIKACTNETEVLSIIDNR